ncbi:nucleoside hydrolase [Bifidobacterium vespertilionis]|uniref:Nucleoside hydrolase n=1 Tax=Bifidobacterium vespertilionis TaxID=2562524 RepID=A0A5J5DVK9_9BIFI|nr:nucleoside hydrolase [Bifidobacterium vespertilionis]KAA8820928.1 nucleoside hydrolase [Bifidobacterium vespertilionis]KAA8822686.1 nucleoside hydrolase [Bifidobacterium vespertilionis]
MTATPRIVLDVDTGIDDTLALCYLLDAARTGECELAGVVGTYGNVLASTAVRNNRAVLDLFAGAVPGAAGIPVLRGCVCPAWVDGFAVDEGCARFHGTNGLGNVRPPVPSTLPAQAVPSPGAFALAEPSPVSARVATLSRPAVLSLGGERHDLTPGESANRSFATRPSEWRDGDEPPAGVRFIIDEVRAHGRAVTVLATGPLTDVAAAIKAAPDIVPDLKLVIMGGALTQEGNCYDLICETNIFQDPESANLVFRTVPDVMMIGLDVTHQCLMTRADAAAWRATGTPAGAFLADMVGFYINANEASDPVFLAGSPLHDPLAAAVALDPSLVTCFDVNMMVETATGNGHGFRGRTIGDPIRLRKWPKTAHVALDVDAGRFIAAFRDRLANLCAHA